MRVAEDGVGQPKPEEDTFSTSSFPGEEELPTPPSEITTSPPGLPSEATGAGLH